MSERETTEKEIRLRVVVLDEGCGRLVAQCLEHDIAVQAKTMRGLVHAFYVALGANIAIAVREGREPLKNIKPAPDFYVKKFLDAEFRLHNNSRPENPCDNESDWSFDKEMKTSTEFALA